jgi:hypothetical protein
MGVDYMVYVIEKRDDLPQAVKDYLNRVYSEEITIGNMKYYHTFDVNNDNSSEDFEQALEKMPAGSYAGSYFG